MMRRLMLGFLLAAVILPVNHLLAPPASAVNTPQRTVRSVGYYKDCRAARLRHILGAGAACYRYTRYGALTITDYKTYVPRRPKARGARPPKHKAFVAVVVNDPINHTSSCRAGIDWNCMGPPNPNAWYYGDSWIESVGPAGLWQVVTYYHVKLNGYDMVPTQPVDCQVPVAFGVNVNVTRCAFDVYDTPQGKRFAIDTQWRECFVHPVFGFCHTKGHRMVMDGTGTVTDRKSW